MSRQLFVPPGWALTTLGEVCQVVGGATPDTKDPSLWGEDVPWLTPADLAANPAMYVSRGGRGLSSKGFATTSTRMLPAGSVLFSSRAPIGYVAINTEPVCTNQGFKSLVPPAGVVPEYLYWYMRWATPLVRSAASGTTFAEVSGKVVKSLPLLLPPTDEQQRIAEKLTEFMSRAEDAKASLERLLRLGRALRATLDLTTVESDPTATSAGTGLTRGDLAAARESAPARTRAVAATALPGLTTGWPTVSLSELAWDIDYGTSTKCSYDGRGRAVLRIPNVVNGQVSFDDLKYAQEPTVDLSGSVVEPGDVLVVRTNGSKELIGRCAAVHQPTEVSFASYLIRLRLLTEVVEPNWVVLTLSSPRWRRLLEARAASTAGQHNLSIEKLSDVPIPVPPLAVQRALVARHRVQVDHLAGFTREVQRRARDLEALKLSALQTAFRGEFAPSTGEGGAAAALLQRVIDERGIRTDAAGSPAGTVRRRPSRRQKEIA